MEPKDDKMEVETIDAEEKPRAKKASRFAKEDEKKDFSKEVAEKLPQLKKLALEEGKLSEALDRLFALEKQTRVGEDEPSTSRVACCIVDVCFEANDFAALKESLVHIAKRRGQMKDTIQKMVVEAMTFIPKIQDLKVKLDLIDTLRLITEGKIFVEVERARLTKILADIKEAEGDVNEAANLLQEVQVETYGAMDPRERIEFILDQMRLTIAKGDYVRAQIISRKIVSKAFANEDVQDLKIRYYELMVKYYLHHKDYLNTCKSYRAMYDTKAVQEDRSRWEELLRLIVLYIILSPRDNEQSDLIHRINEDKKLQDLPKYKALLKFFITRALVRWPVLERSYADELNQLPVFQGDLRPTLWKDLHSRVVEHNIGVIAQYYERISLSRFSELLDLSTKETEQFVSDMVSNGSVWAKIDRPKGVASFTKRKDPSEVLNDWSHNVGDLLNQLEKTCHLINREIMVHENKLAVE